jgi:hypothetical protein
MLKLQANNGEKSIGRAGDGFEIALQANMKKSGEIRLRVPVVFLTVVRRV